MGPLVFSLIGSSSHNRNAVGFINGFITTQAYLGVNFTVDSATAASFALLGTISGSGEAGSGLEVILNENGNRVVYLNSPSNTGSFNLSNTFTLQSGNSYELILNGVTNIGVSSGASSGSITNMALSMTVVPEPSTYALLALGVGAILCGHRRRKVT